MLLLLPGSLGDLICIRIPTSPRPVGEQRPRAAHCLIVFNITGINSRIKEEIGEQIDQETTEAVLSLPVRVDESKGCPLVGHSHPDRVHWHQSRPAVAFTVDVVS